MFFSKSLYIRRGDTKDWQRSRRKEATVYMRAWHLLVDGESFFFSFIGMVAITFVTFLSMVAFILISLFLLSLLTGLTFVLSSRAALQVLRGAPTLVPLLILLCFLL